MFPRNSLTPRAAHPLPPLPRFFVCACARVDVARPRCEAAEITGSLLRPPAANPKEANAMSERSLRINSDDGGGKESSGWRRMEAEFISGRGREKREGTENKKLPISADRNPYTDPLRPILVVISFDFFSFACFLVRWRFRWFGDYLGKFVLENYEFEIILNSSERVCPKNFLPLELWRPSIDDRAIRRRIFKNDLVNV